MTAVPKEPECDEFLTDWEILGQAVAECKRAFLDAVAGVLSPILDAVVRFLDALER